MGGAESRFNVLLVEGKEEEALTLWKENFQLQAYHNPNVQIKSSCYRDSPLHCAVRHEMRELTADFLSRGGDPFVVNGKGETPLHLVCRSSKNSSRQSKKRADYLGLLLDRVPSEESFEVIQQSSSFRKVCDVSSNKSGFFGSLTKEKTTSLTNGCPSSLVDTLKCMPDGDACHLGVLDRSRNTPLHLAAASGLLECVELLVAHNAPLFACNIADQTPCDVAWESKQIIIAKQLESKMVFGSEIDLEASLAVSTMRTRNKSFHNTQALKLLKNDIILDVAGKLEISEFSAHALLMAYGWSEELLKEAWTADRVAACEKAGIMIDHERPSKSDNSPTLSLTIHTCGICEEEIAPQDKIMVPCKHVFCENCWRMYLEGQINEGGGKEIRCPMYQCFKLVPNNTISKLISEGQMEKYSNLTIQQFVDNSADIRWCPYPDCNYAVYIQRDKEVEVPEEVGGATAIVSSKKMTPAENVECGQGHGFCWNCMRESHAPCSCELWEKWKDVVITNMSEEDREKIMLEAQANAQWITNNTKPCPNCKAPIQKDDGCNHISCKKCRHDFCWVCLDPWQVHNHRTGGYFICNRWNAQQKAKKDMVKVTGVMEKDYMDRAYHDLEMQQSKFEHYYNRYSNHLQSLDIEIELLQRSQAKLKEMERLGQALDKKVALVRSMTLFDTVKYADEACRSFPNLKGNFLDHVFRALLHARRILAASYCLGYFLPEDRTEALQAHEALQGKLEEAVEILSQMANREYLLIPRHKMSKSAQQVEFLCEEYLVEMKEVAIMAGRVVLGIEDEERRRQREEERRIEEEERAARPPSPPTLDEIIFLEHLIRLMDDQGRLHILFPPRNNNGAQGAPIPFEPPQPTSPTHAALANQSTVSALTQSN